MSKALKLLALDEEDLTILSAHLQDAVLRVDDLDFDRPAGKFIVQMNRFAWESDGRRKWFFKRNERRRAVLSLDRVTAVRTAGIDRDHGEAVLSLLAISFDADDEQEPAGTVTMDFSGGASLQADVEVIEARLTDLGAAWSASARPRHNG